MDFLSLLVIGLFLMFVITSLFQWLWNITMPEVFNLKEISFWIAFRLLLLAGLLTSGGLIKFNWNR